MRILPVNLNQSFNGIKKFSHREQFDDPAQEVIVDVLHYDYYPFKDETPDEYPQDTVEYQAHPYPCWSTLSGDEYHIHTPLSITEAEYKKLSLSSSDENIIKYHV